MKSIRTILCTVVVVTLLIQLSYGLSSDGISIPQDNFHISEETTDLSGVKVAVYEGYSSDICDNSRIALFNMFSWMNATVDILNSSQIYMGEEIWDYDILAVPDGLAPRFELRLGIIGLEIIRDWVSRGGSFFGVRAGGTLACAYSEFEGNHEEYRMKLFNGTGYGPLAELDEMCITTLDINVSALPTFSGAPSTLDVLYRVSRYFEAAERQEVIPIGNYNVNGGLGMFAFHYGTGCAFLSGVDPEFEENSDRDGTEFRDELDDPDSEWTLMLDVCRWMIEESEWTSPEQTTTAPTVTTNPTSTLTPTNTTGATIGENLIAMVMISLGGGIGVIAIFVVIIAIKKR